MLANYTTLFKKYNCWLNNQKYAHNTKNNYSKIVTHFLSYLSEFEIINLKDASIGRILAFIAKRGTTEYAEAYFNLRLAALGLFYAWAYTHKLCPNNPIITYKKSKMHSKLLPPKGAKITNNPLVLSAKEQQALLKLKSTDIFTTTRNKCIMALILGTALYADEVVHLELKDLNLTQGTLTIHSTKGKRIISIDTTLQKVCHKWLALRVQLLQKNHSPWLFITNTAKPLAKRVLYRIIDHCMQKAGIHKAHQGPELLRQTAITNMLHSGLTLEEVQALTGIKTLTNIQRYQN